MIPDRLRPFQHGRNRTMTAEGEPPRLNAPQDFSNRQNRKENRKEMNRPGAAAAARVCLMKKQLSVQYFFSTFIVYFCHMRDTGFLGSLPVAGKDLMTGDLIQ